MNFTFSQFEEFFKFWIKNKPADRNGILWENVISVMSFMRQ